METPAPWRRETDETLFLAVRLTPKSAADKIEGVVVLSDGKAVLKIRVRAVPEDGKANQALLALLAKSLDLPLAALSLRSGAASRLKIIAIAGEAEAIEAKLLAYP